MANSASSKRSGLRKLPTQARSRARVEAILKAAGELLSRPAAYRVAIAAADVALAHLPRFVIYNGLNAWGKHREVPHPPAQTFHSWHRGNRGGKP